MLNTGSTEKYILTTMHIVLCCSELCSLKVLFMPITKILRLACFLSASTYSSLKVYDLITYFLTYLL